MSSSSRVVVIGAGPAGIRAAEALVAQGLRPVLIDEAPIGGGQIYRQPPAGLRRPYRALYGFEAGKAQRLHATLERLRPQIDYRPDTLVWDIREQTLFTACAGQVGQIEFDRLIIASGAMDRVIPLPGWLTAGVYTLGAAQVALKAQGAAVGDPIVFMGTGPLLYLVAYQYAKAGAKVAAVLDTSTAAARWRALPKLAAAPDVLAKGAYYVAWLRLHGITLRHGVRPIAIEGDTRVQAVVWEHAGRQYRTPTDAVAFGYGLRSETQLADLAGCTFEFDALNHQWLPQRTAAGRSSRADIYLAGDGAGIAGADAAELTGRRAALAVAQDLGLAHEPQQAQALEQQLSRIRTVRAGLEAAFPFPVHLARELPDEVPLCRCEEITAGEYRRCADRLQAREMNRAKAFTRVGMGRCQGRVCGAAAAEVLAATCQLPVAEVGRLRGQAPVKPLFLDLEQNDNAAGAP